MKHKLDIQIFQHSLKNGLKVILLPDSSLPIISYYTFFRVGSRNERPGITGISHLFEHMMFKGSKKYPEGIFDKILTANGGFSNAYTSRDMTVYYQVFPNQLLPQIIDMEVDRLSGLNISEESLESERQVVIEERLLRTDNSLEGFLMEQLYANAYVAHPYQWPIIGWLSDLQQISLPQCLEYHKIYYAPNNAILAIGGDFNPEQVLTQIESAYETVPAQVSPPPVVTKEPPQAGEKRITIHKEAQHPYLYIAYHSIPATDPNLAALDMFQMIFNTGRSSRLVSRLVEKEKIANNVYGAFGYDIDPGLYYFVIELKSDNNFNKVIEILDEELEKVDKNSLTDEEIQKAINILITDYYHNFTTVENKVHEIGRSGLLFDDPSKILDFPEKYNRVKKKDIIDIKNQIFTMENRTVIQVIPKK
ncbi:MAG: pitrilysin family protein [Calditrichia bacterium]